MSARTSADFEAYLASRGIAVTVRRMGASTATSQEAADAIGCALGQIAKSLCFVVEDPEVRPVLVIAAGDRKVDDRKLAAIFGVNRRRVRIATPDECVSIWSYAPGGVPPLGHDMRVLVDRSLERFDRLHAAAGAPDAVFAIDRAELVRLTGGELVELARDQP
jgi:prolyl-tRNA editing enzyme YbaK/EbsC (Cys-tRNA(Pro) deacylase)